MTRRRTIDALVAAPLLAVAVAAVAVAAVAATAPSHIHSAISLPVVTWVAPDNAVVQAALNLGNCQANVAMVSLVAPHGQRTGDVSPYLGALLEDAPCAKGRALPRGTHLYGTAHLDVDWDEIFGVSFPSGALFTVTLDGGRLPDDAVIPLGEAPTLVLSAVSGK